MPDNSNIDELEVAAALLEASGKYRVLRRIRSCISKVKASPGTKIGAVLDLETTGLDVEHDEIIELAMIKFAFDDNGNIAGRTGEFTSLNEPSNGVPEAITDLTGISAQDVAGKSLDISGAEIFLQDVQIIIAHNAYFDRPIAERYIPVTSSKAWACSATEIPWRSEGVSGAKLEYLLSAYGLFYDAHRALDDCSAVLELLGQELPKSRRSVLGVLLEAARQPRFRLYALEAGYDARGALKGRGYKWNSGANGAPKAWWIDVSKDELEPEQEFLKRQVGLTENVPIRRLTALNRFKSALA